MFYKFFKSTFYTNSLSFHIILLKGAETIYSNTLNKPDSAQNTCFWQVFQLVSATILKSLSKLLNWITLRRRSMRILKHNCASQTAAKRKTVRDRERVFAFTVIWRLEKIRPFMNFADMKPVPDKKINILLMFSVTVFGAVFYSSLQSDHSDSLSCCLNLKEFSNLECCSCNQIEQLSWIWELNQSASWINHPDCFCEQDQTIHWWNLNQKNHSFLVNNHLSCGISHHGMTSKDLVYRIGLCN